MINGFNRFFLLVGLIMSLLLLFSCKNEEQEAREKEKRKINNYLNNTADTTYQEDDNGLYYHIVNSGNDDIPENNDFVNVSVINNILGNDPSRAFSDTNDYFIVGSTQFILGINIGIKLIGEGGIIDLIIPFDLAYNAPSSDFDVYNTYHSTLKLKKVIDNPEEWEMNRIDNYIEQQQFDVEKNTTGFYYITQKKGEGDSLQNGDLVALEYEAKYLDGAVFDQHNFFQFTIGSDRVIEGLEKGVLEMNKGGEAILIIPSDLAYGDEYYRDIHPYATLVFDIKIYNQ